MDAKPGKKDRKPTAGSSRPTFALVFCLPLVAFVSVATGATGIVLGVTGHVLAALDARTLGPLAVVPCTLAMFVGLLVGLGIIPGFAYDRLVLDGWFREMPTERFTEG